MKRNKNSFCFRVYPNLILKIKNKGIVQLPAILFFLAVGFYSCRPASLDKRDLLKYIDSHKSLSPELHIGQLQAQLKYVPPTLLADQELSGQSAKRTNPKEFRDSVYAKYAPQYYFRLQLSINGKEAIRQLGSFGRYSDMLQVLSFDMSKYIHCITSNRDTLPLKDYAFEQTFGMTDANNLLLAFDNKKIRATKHFKIIIEECGFGAGNMVFGYKTSDIMNVPKLIEK